MKAIYFVNSDDNRDEIFISEPENEFSKEDYVDISVLLGLSGKQHSTDLSNVYLRIKTYKGKWKEKKVSCIQIIIGTNNTEISLGIERYKVISFIFFIEQENNSRELAENIINKITKFAENYGFNINEPSKQELEKLLPKIIEGHLIGHKLYVESMKDIAKEHYKELVAFLFGMVIGALLTKCFWR